MDIGKFYVGIYKWLIFLFDIQNMLTWFTDKYVAAPVTGLGTRTNKGKAIRMLY